MGRRRALGERGSVTAETVVVLPVLMVVLCAGLWALACVSAQLRCADAAHGGARALARGETLAAVEQRTRDAAPSEATVGVGRVGELVTVHVSAEVRPLGGLSSQLPGLTVRASSSAAVEPGS